MATEYFWDDNIGFAAELVGGPSDGRLAPLLIDGKLTHPSRLPPGLQITDVPRVNVELLCDGNGQGGRRPEPGEFIYAQAIYQFDGYKPFGGKIIPFFQFVEETNVVMPKSNPPESSK